MSDHPHPDFAFDAESEAEIARTLRKYPADRKASAVIPVLYIAQRQMARQTASAWLPKTAIEAVAARLDLRPIRVQEIATFYTMFNTRPVGRYHLQLCTTTPCWLRGSDDVAEACRNLTGITRFGETSDDGMFTLSEVECLGGCVNAPILQVNDDFYEDMDAPKTFELLVALRRNEKPVPGSLAGRQTSAPEGGPTTLTTLPDRGPGAERAPRPAPFGAATYPNQAAFPAK